MENTPRLYDELLKVIGQHGKWLDLRHLHTLVWMVVGLLQAGSVSLPAWVPFVQGRARYAQSSQRRFARWLHNKRIAVQTFYAPLIEHALVDWGKARVYLALDTTLLWNQYGVVRLALLYRGRAVALVWHVLKHGSRSVAHEVSEALVDAVPALLPRGVKVGLLADRGFADTELMGQLQRLGWHFRIRVKASLRVRRRGQMPGKIEDFPLAPGRALFLHHVAITDHPFGPVSLALARHTHTGAVWYVVSDEPTSVHTFGEYGWRFDIEENCWDDKSNGFQLESARLRDANAVERVCGVLAVATLYLVAQGTHVVAIQKRRWGDPQWWRGNSSLRLGWQWVRTALARGWELAAPLHLSGEPAPAPAKASAAPSAHAPPVTFTNTYVYAPA